MEPNEATRLRNFLLRSGRYSAPGHGDRLSILDRLSIPRADLELWGICSRGLSRMFFFRVFVVGPCLALTSAGLLGCSGNLALLYNPGNNEFG
jgi:hypothetical protein